MKTILFLGIFLMLASTAFADIAQCPNGVVQIGAPIGEAIIKCGPPQYTSKNTYYDTNEKGETITTVYEELTYNIPGCQAVLTFINGRLGTIKHY